ncbi:uncharacterized protein LOC120081866 [Benincasa hispida]|uniref:uncharacterized protein LOC120081866 n=1 Tax=Benincasa hispida TaxID=102211 RepID=UPI0018FF1C97|nr:uncharacterized protein LOC120081866 [Benincasa hispida]
MRYRNAPCFHPHHSGSRSRYAKIHFQSTPLKVLQLHEREDLSDDFFSLVMGPSSEVCSYNGCIVNEVRFHTIERDNGRVTQNSGVLVAEEISGNGSFDNNFNVVLNDVLDF